MRVLVLALLGATMLTGHAQAAQHCGGWPHKPGVPGLIVAKPGVRCEGQLFRTRYGPATLVDVQASKQFDHGSSFRLIGLDHFEYTPAPGQSGYERIVLNVTWMGAHGAFNRRIIYLATTEDQAYRSGAQTSAPPPGFEESFEARRRLLHGSD